MKKSIFLILILRAALLPAQEGEPRDHAIYPSCLLEEYYGYARGIHENYWLVIGGRMTGADGADVLSSFNPELMVLDWDYDTVVTMQTLVFPLAIREQLTASNMSYYQEGSTLNIVGGYGYRSSAKSCSTIPAFMTVDIHAVIDAILNHKDPRPFIKQVADERLAVRDAVLRKEGDYFFLAGGERAYKIHTKEDDDFYFVKSCEDQVLQFKINAKGTDLEVTDFQEWNDLENFCKAYGNIFPRLCPAN